MNPEGETLPGAEHDRGGPEYNRLIFSSSPYLLQHARNPVDWYPWGEEAFARARTEHKPIFLSIGYSTCHWCHVMERESFEDEDVAALLRASFVAIKVDREERPDIDHIYMSACQALSGGGGWPLSLFLTPERMPFFAGTYFPKEDRYGRPGFRRLLEAVAEGWERDSGKITEAAAQLLAHLARSGGTGHGEDNTEAGSQTGQGPSPRLPDDAVRQLVSTFDAENGGFGGAPKFPMGHALSFLLRRQRRSGDASVLRAVETTLRAMHRGGIHDHVGGGFCRYATDAQWHIPHFEKMLYDNALLAMAYADAWQSTGRDEYAAVARDVLAYALRELRSPEGMFFSAEDADSEGEEGKFYAFGAGEFREAVGGEHAGALADYFGVAPQGNFENGATVLHIAVDAADWRRRHGFGEDEAASLLADARSRLFAARARRVRPALDDKVLCSWNGLMIAALARAGQALGDADMTRAAALAADAVLARFMRSDSGLLHRAWRGVAGIDGMLEDYAFLIWGLADLYQATFAGVYLVRAVALARRMLAEFGDEGGRGGLFLSPSSQDDVVLRMKDSFDGALPSGNSAAAFGLLRLARMTGDTDFETAALGILQAFSGTMAAAPSGHTMMLAAFDLALGPSVEIVLAGPDPASVEPFARAVRERYLPHAVLLFHPSGPDGEELRSLCPFLRHQTMRDGRPTAYVCRNFACEDPVTDLDAFRLLLDES